MTESTFKRFGGICAAGVALFTLAYAVALLIGSPVGEAGLVGRAQAAFEARGLNDIANYSLALAGLLMTAAMVATYGRVAEFGKSLATWATALGVIGAVMMTVHGYWEAIRMPILLDQWDTGSEMRQQAIAAFSFVPNPVDPRGIGSFLLVGVFVLAVSWLILVSGNMSRVTGQWGALYGAFLVLLFVVGALGYWEARMWVAVFTVGLAAPVWWVLVARDLLSRAP